MRRRHSLAAITLLLSAPVAAWWAVGDLSTVDPTKVEADYVVEPIELNAQAEQAIGIAASVLAVGTASSLAVAIARASVAPRWGLVILPLLVLAMSCGFAYRVGTAAVIGANIGWGMIVLVGVPFTWAMLLTSSRQWRKVHGHA